MSVRSFEINIPEEETDDLNGRLAATRWPDSLSDVGWDYGTNGEYLRDLVAYWGEEFDWRAQETRLNGFDHYRAEVDGLGIHFVHERGTGGDATPLLLLHGWPGSFVQMLDLLPMLTDPSAHGGEPEESFDVVAASLIGFGFSDRPREPGMSVAEMSEYFHRLMTEELGYERYAARGSDLGEGVIQQLALAHPDALIGIHLSGTNPYLGEVPDDLSEAEAEFVETAREWDIREMAYAKEQSTKPQTLAYALNDSPAGLAGWILEKFWSWSDHDGDLEAVYAKDDLLTNLTVYWATETIGSSVRLYYESARDPGKWGKPEVPTAMLMSPRDMFPTPREWAERSYRIDRWTETTRGGHFLEWEVPKTVAEDLRAFFGEGREDETAIE
ncbi:epoxide hydrolase family protein [Halegenticoccus tardaugens]|uniref:epoxide hydrolase family protein n=1 Tax=Halegenticoccus tardaugens TaxID=2071624 RepID=UPI00100BED72|nr:epoxide hydrolase family protein [Halegenticoccus tardaugens]